MEKPNRNETAYAIGFIFAWFFVCGMAHIYTGKIGRGVTWMFVLGPAHYIMGVIACFTVIGAPWGLKLMLRMIQRQAEEGAALA